MLVNVHSHVFNLQAVLSRGALDVVRDRLEREIRPEALGRAVAAVLTDALTEPPSLDEGRLVRELVDEIGDEIGLDQLKDDLPGLARRLVEQGLDDLAGLAVFQLVDGLDRALNRRDGDARDSGLTDGLATLRLAFQQSTADVALRLFHQLGPERGAVALMMDIAGDDPTRFEKQVEDLRQLVLRYPGRIFPFFAIHPEREGHLERMETALEEEGFAGVKLYPSLGYEMGSDALRRVLAKAAELDAPLLSHTSPGGFYKDEASRAFSSPEPWGELLDEIPGFRICFAHFGGTSNLTQEAIPQPSADDALSGWAHGILELMRGEHGGRVFTDIAFHTPQDEGAEGEARYLGHLMELLAEDGIGDRVLFGTDSWLVRTRLSEASYWRFFRDQLADVGLGEERFRRMAEANNHRFLGLPLASEGLAMGANFERYVDFIHEHRDRLDGSKPADWLLDALGGKDPEAAEALRRRTDWAVADSLGRIAGFEELLEVIADRTLNAPLTTDRGHLPVADASFSLGSAGLNLQGDADLSIHLYNDVDDVTPPERGSARPEGPGDPEGVLAPAPPAASEADLFALEAAEPPVVFDPDHAWLEYRLEGNLRLRGSAGLGAVGLEAAAEATAILADYRRHRREQPLAASVRRDLAWPRFAVDVEDVLRLEPGDAVSFHVRGKIEAAVRVAWSDVLSFGLPRLARALGSTEPIGVEVTGGVKIYGSVHVKDDFRIVFSRPEDLRDGSHPWRAEVRKVATRGESAGIQVGAVMAWEQPQVVRQLLEHRLGDPLNRIEALFQKAGVEDLGPLQTKLFDRVSTKLGVTSLSELKEELKELRERVEETLDELVESKLEVGFSYEYSRLETDTALLVAHLDAGALRRIHGQLVRGQLSAVVERARGLDHENRAAGEAGPEPTGPDDGIDLRHWAVQEEAETVRSSGFSLSFGRWLRIASRDESRLIERTQRSRVGDEQLVRYAYLGSREYQAEWPGGKWRWDVDLDARMERVSPHPVPRLSDFTYGLSILVRWQRTRLTEKSLGIVLDAAALWGVLPEAEGPEGERGYDALAHHLDRALGERSKLDASALLDRQVTFRLQLLLDHTALASLLPPPGLWGAEAEVRARRRLASALAAALPYRKSSELHRRLSERREVYEALFRTYFQDVLDGSGPFVLDRRLPRYQELAKARLTETGYGGKRGASLEDSPDSRTQLSTFAGALHNNRTLAQSWQRLYEALSTLAKGLHRNPEPEYGQFEDVFFALRRFLQGGTHNVRALGAYLMDLARLRAMPEGVSPSLGIEVEGESREITLGPGAP